MALLERDAQLEVLDEFVEAARRGHGRLAWVQGEAGVGKTTLVERFCAQLRGAQVATGMCDPFVTPRPLGPLVEIIEQLGLVEGEELSREALATLLVEELSARALPTVMVVEDAHWADEATLDVLRFVGRRLAGLRALVVVTFREEELDAVHPLRILVGDLATAPGIARLEVPVLSHAAVAALADAAGGRDDVDALYAQTGGNSFFVTEVLAADGNTLPVSVRDAVLARAARLPPDARTALEAAAVVPGRVETWLVDALVEGGAAGLDACVRVGVLSADAPGTVAFRHELARRAVDEALPPARRVTLHARVAEQLRVHDEETDESRLAYHAEQAGDRALACRYASRAARRAAELGSHREAVGQYERAVRHDDDLSDADRAGLLERYSVEAVATDRIDAAVEAITRAVALRRRLGDRRSLGVSLRLQSRALWNRGQSGEAAEANHEAIRILEALEPGAELADAYASAASYAMLARDHAAALRWGGKAITLAERLGAAWVLADGLNSVGASKLVHGQPEGVDDLRRSITVAAEAGHEDLVARGWLNLGSGAGEVRDYATAEPALREAVACAADRDLDTCAHYGTAWLARVRFERGDWREAADLIAGLPPFDAATSAVTTIVALGVRGRLHTRCGDADPWPDLDRAWALATETGDLQRLWPIAAARAEAAWLAGDSAAICGLVDDVYALACERDLAWAVGELGLWRHRAGSADALPDVAAEPYALHITGRHAEAAARWQQLGCPYEAADALADSDEATPLREALETLDRLDAASAGARVRQRLRALGERHIPRGPRQATAANPAGLTPRQVEVLELVAIGSSDADIAARLHLSPKTVGHHVSAILAKLEVTSRGEAAHRARALGIASEEPGSGPR